MKQTLSIKMGQHLTMTPQLQQAIKLLQLSTLDLQQEIQTALESNPMLELDDDEAETGEGDSHSQSEEPATEVPEENEFDGPMDSLLGEVGGEAGAEVAGEYDRETSIPEDLPVDTQWEDLYTNGSSSGGAAAEEDWNNEDRDSAGETLQDHLLWQLNLTPVSDLDRAIGTAIIDAIDADGMLADSVENIVETMGPFEPDEPALEAEEGIAVLKLIQQFDPVGVGARNLGECLSLQLNQLPPETPWLKEALQLVGDHLEILGARDFATLKRKTRLSEDELAEVLALIQTLNPRPGSSITTDSPEYIVPDVFVTKKKGRWSVELNAESTPKLRINNLYAGLVKRADSSSDNSYLRDNLQEARWFLKSLQSRNETLLKVATKIVEHQRGFLEYGEEAMKPLVLHDIADAVEMHESTISRVTNRKYMHTPRGIFELKYFFSSHVSTNTGGEVSSTAIRALIRKLTAEENPRKPLSDNRIAAILADQNIQVARRTVAKYRESMSIPPSNERKRLV